MTAVNSIVAEYLVNQVTHTCLAVISGSNAHDAVIGLAKCSGGKEQQWFPVDGKWQWGGDRTLCLFKDESSKKLCLVDCNSVSESWILDEERRLIMSSDLALTAPRKKPAIQVVLEKKRKTNNNNQKWWTLSRLQTKLADDHLLGEHSLPPAVLDMCKKELNKRAPLKMKGKKNQQQKSLLEKTNDFMVPSCEGEMILDEEAAGGAEYLIHQKTLNCLTVLNGEDPTSATISLQPFSGGVNQQWFIDGQHWHWGGNISYCLVAKVKKNEVKLGHMRNKITPWNFNDRGVMRSKGKALNVPLDEPRDKVILAPLDAKGKGKWWKLSEVRATLLATPGSVSGYPEALLAMAKKLPDQDTAVEDQCEHESDFDGPSGEGNTIQDEEASVEAEYLISQSTLNCLTVLNGDDPSSATISLQPFSGNINQQWFIDGQRWHWGGNRSYCLAGKGKENEVKLDHMSNKINPWNFNNRGVMRSKGMALNVPLDEPRDKIILAPPNVKGKEKWWKLSEVRATLLATPGSESGYPEALLAMARELPDQDSSVEGQCEGTRNFAGPSCEGEIIQDEEASVEAEYLISQSTLNCLTVLNGDDPSSATISLQPFSGSINQQWFIDGQRWHWGGNRSYCLAGKGNENEVKLDHMSNEINPWNFNNRGVMRSKGMALNVPLDEPRDKIILAPPNAKGKEKWWKLSEVRATLLATPGSESGYPEALLALAKELPDQDSSVEGQCEGARNFVGPSCEGEIIQDEDASVEAEYLISQSTLNCLTVLNGDDPTSATISLQPFSGSINQQWFIDGQRWHWGGNRSYCLAGKGNENEVKLDHMSNKINPWNFNNRGVMRSKGMALNVPLDEPRDKIILAPPNAKGKEKWWKLSEVRATLLATPGSVSGYPEALLAMAKELPDQESSVEGQCEVSENVLVEEACHHVEETSLEEPEYLISQGTHFCLTAKHDENLDEFVLILSPYSGETKQQWFVKDGIWQWGYDRSYRLSADLPLGKLNLVPSNEGKTVWNFDKGIMSISQSHALSITYEGDEMKLNLKPKEGKKSQKWWLLSELKPLVGRSLYPIPSDNLKQYRHELLRGLVNSLSPLSEPLPFPRDVAHYPGSVSPLMPRINKSFVVKFETQEPLKPIRMKTPNNWQATSMYVVAGEIFSVVLPDSLTSKQAKDITLRVGAQTDNLNPILPKIKNKGFKRMPIISETFDVHPGSNSLRSQYGGNLIFMYHGKETIEVKVDVQNVVETPRYILGKTSNEEWQKIKEIATPFSILESSKVVIVVKTFRARKLSEPDILLQRYDDVIDKINDLGGFSDDDPPPKGKQWLVDDIQTKAGSAHTGFPIMIQHRFNDLASLETPHAWVIWHEIGHNYQQKKFWSHAYGMEATANLFSLYVQEKLKGADRLTAQNKYAQTATAVDSGIQFNKLEPMQKLVFLMEIKHAFPEHGWNMFRHLNKATRALSHIEASVLRANHQKQIDYVYKTLSRFVGADLIDHYKRWGVKVSQKAKEEIESLDMPKAPGNLSGNCPKSRSCS